MKVLLATIVIGEKYQNEYNQLFRPSHESYANKCGYDFKMITNYLDNNIHQQNICMNKFLLCSQTWSFDYDFIIYIDADILININAPPLHSYYDYSYYIGMIDEFSQPTKDIRLLIQKHNGWETSATDYYKLSDFDINTDMVFNGGVSIMQPKIHKDFLQDIYDKYIHLQMNHPRGFHFEQSCIGYNLIKNKMYKVIDNRFNAIWVLYKMTGRITLEDFFKQNYFIHFAGNIDYDKVSALYKNYNFLNMDIKDENDKAIDVNTVEKTEQDLARQFIEENDVVLELGARYGSVSCIINSKLINKKNQVSVEPDERVHKALERNKQANNCEFNIVKGFISGKKLNLTEINSYEGYGTKSIEDNNTTIPSFTLDEIKMKYNLNFNVLVADCEGFLETFFDENPNFYDKLRLIIFEADCPDKCNYNKIRNTLLEKKFTNLLDGFQNVWIK
jgi:FkbM family methyltransferase